MDDVGDIVDVVVNARGNIEIVAPASSHRHVIAPGRVSSDALFERFPVQDIPPRSAAWPNDDMVGAEWESWSR